MIEPVTTTKAATVAVSAAVTFWDIKASELLKFTSEVLSAIAWPIAAMFIVNLFKKEIIERIPRLSELSLPGGISAKFKEGLAKVEAEVSAIPPAPTIEGHVTYTEPEEVMTTTGHVAEPAATYGSEEVKDNAALRANPTGVVMESWKGLEELIRQCTMRIVSPSASQLPSSIMVKALSRQGFLSDEDEKSLLELVKLRNLVAHVPEKTVSEIEAQRFNEIAEKFKGRLAAKLTRHLMKTRNPPPPSGPGNL